jgi:hypothetical protein
LLHSFVIILGSIELTIKMIKFNGNQTHIFFPESLLVVLLNSATCNMDTFTSVIPIGRRKPFLYVTIHFALLESTCASSQFHKHLMSHPLHKTIVSS